MEMGEVHGSHSHHHHQSHQSSSTGSSSGSGRGNGGTEISLPPPPSSHPGGGNSKHILPSHQHHQLHAQYSSSPHGIGQGSSSSNNNTNSSIGQLLSMLNDISPEDPIENLLVVSSSQDPHQHGSPGLSTTLLPSGESNSNNPHTLHSSSFMESTSSSNYQSPSPEYHIAYSRRKNSYYSEDPGEEYFASPGASLGGPSHGHPQHHPHHPHPQHGLHPSSLLSESKTEDYDAPSSSSVASSTTPAHLGPRDDKYWERRRKNNMAAKKSRDARRVRENQLRLKVLCLENANQVLRTQLKREKDEHDKSLMALNKEKEDNKILRHKLSRFDLNTSAAQHQHHHATSQLSNSL